MTLKRYNVKSPCNVTAQTRAHGAPCPTADPLNDLADGSLSEYDPLVSPTRPTAVFRPPIPPEHPCVLLP